MWSCGVAAVKDVGGLDLVGTVKVFKKGLDYSIGFSSALSTEKSNIL